MDLETTIRKEPEMATNSIAPLFEHDCERCVFLGRADGKAMGWGADEVDLYYCPDGMFSQHSYLMRFGHEGPDYCFGDLENDLRWPRSQEAYRRAFALGLVEEMPEGSAVPYLEPGDQIDFSKSFKVVIGG